MKCSLITDKKKEVLFDKYNKLTVEDVAQSQLYLGTHSLYIYVTVTDKMYRLDILDISFPKYVSTPHNTLLIMRDRHRNFKDLCNTHKVYKDMIFCSEFLTFSELVQNIIRRITTTSI